MNEGLRSRVTKLASAAQSLKQYNAISAAPFCLAFLTDRYRVQHPELIARILPKGAALILRDYDHPRRQALAGRLASICKRRGVIFFVGVDVELAQSVGADGLHLPSWAMQSFSSLPLNLRLTAACHNLDDLHHASRLNAHAAFLSPVFTTASHPGASGIGASAVRSLARKSPIPVIALGGVNECNASKLHGANVAGFAAIGAFLPR